MVRPVGPVNACHPHPGDTVKLNPKTLSWSPPTQYTDGSAFGAADLAGYTFGYRTSGEPVEVLSLPLAFGDTSIPLADLDLPRNVDLQVGMRTNAVNGSQSEWGFYPEALRFDTRVPLAPSAVAVL